MSGIRPAALMMLPGLRRRQEVEELESVLLILRVFVTEKSVTRILDTPLIGEFEYGGTKAATLVPMDWVYFDGVPRASTIMAALPCSLRCAVL